MTVLETPAEARAWTRERQVDGRRVGFVPTMGALHAGHLSLVRRARALADAVAVSIFVNPTQFGPSEDYGRYPRTVEDDMVKLRAEGVDAVYLPDAPTMYPAGFRTVVEVEGFSDVLEGAIRPGHFRGVATVVCKLLTIVPADVAVFGQKDYQQLLIIRRMAEDLNLETHIEAHPIVREADGLAMSSRNRYLSAEERRGGLALSRALAAVRARAAAGETGPPDLEAAAWNVLDAEPGVVTDYAAVVNPETLGPLEPRWERAVCLVAGRLGTTRLIDNTLFDREGNETTA